MTNYVDSKMIRRFSRLLFLVSQLAIFPLAVLGGFLLRFEFAVPQAELSLLAWAAALSVVVKAPVFRLLGVQRGGWRHAGIDELILLVNANLAASATFTIVILLVLGRPFPRSIFILDFLLCLVATSSLRLLLRVVGDLTNRAKVKHGAKRVLIYGAGAAGATLLREIQSNPALGYKVVGFLDDDSDRDGRYTGSVPVLGRGRDAAAVVDRLRRRGAAVDEIVIAMPSASGRQMHEALANCRAAAVACKTVPGVGELLTGKFLSAQIRNVSVTDLLGREPVAIHEEHIAEAVSGKVVMVTGAAGSIGSELCRQIASYSPGMLVALDQAESDLFKIELDLRAERPKLNIVSVVGDIRDSQTVREVIRRCGVDTIYHAAAYKHVPLMERHPLEALRNNILGTWNLATAAYDNMVSCFVMISTDKAVNPTSLMGATKRAAEILLSGLPEDRTRFVSVRFGNVLGSNGSVIPIFQRQIEKGGPVTVTHPEMKRYFMLTREAVQLVLLASTIADKSDILVLDMGEPVRIVDLAKQMIRLSGLEPGKDVEIRYTGLRPGEKLFEELVVGGESMSPTPHRKIWVLHGPQPDRENSKRWLAGLHRLIELRDEASVTKHLKKLIPEYTPHDAAVSTPRWVAQAEPETGTVASTTTA